jgi:hypothetical protein
LSSFAAKRLTGRALWQTGYFERVVRDDQEVRTLAAYILANPVRAGLVEEPWAYPFSGSDRYGKDELATWVQDRPAVRPT